MEGDASGLMLTACARSNDEIMCPGANRRHQSCDKFWIIGAVPIHEDDNVGTTGCLRSQQACAAKAPASRNDRRAGPARTLRRPVLAAAIGDDDPVNDIARKRRNDRADARLL